MTSLCLDQKSNAVKENLLWQSEWTPSRILLNAGTYYGMNLQDMKGASVSLATSTSAELQTEGLLSS